MACCEVVSADEADGDLQPNMIAGNVVVAAVAGIAVILRVTARRVQGLSLGADDYTIIVALVCYLVVHALLCRTLNKV